MIVSSNNNLVTTLTMSATVPAMMVMMHQEGYYLINAVLDNTGSNDHPNSALLHACLHQSDCGCPLYSLKPCAVVS